MRTQTITLETGITINSYLGLSKTGNKVTKHKLKHNIKKVFNQPIRNEKQH